ncbi:hypothetical protein ATANTOWER_015734 [Ataeniobius toweri]|uniref:Ig-like domain-containing protein n=1 Tax=Ataeniobius toweri TaxID=208326 RepID=A0ABU7BPX9_9TELE|nr:hypothetical protein [Ataeniobius toweri]
MLNYDYHRLILMLMQMFCASILKIRDSDQINTLLSVSSVADAMVTWLRDGNPMKTGPRLQQRQDGTCLILTMDRVTQVDDGMYGCQLTTAEGLTVASATWMLRVSRKSSTPDPACPSLCPFTVPCLVVSPSGVSKSPVFLSQLQDCSISEGQPISLEVRVEGKPAPRVSWQFNGQCSRKTLLGSLFPL